VSLSYRPLLVPVVALATAGVVAVGPTMGPQLASLFAPGATPLPIPAAQVHEVQLAGIGQDIYDAITPYVQYVVGGVSYLINFIPLIGGPVAAQININYFQGVQPVVESTVDYLAAVVQDPFDLIAATSAYGGQLYGIAYNWVDAELRFLGLPRLAPLAEETGPVGAAGSRTGAAAAPAAAAAPVAPVAPSVAVRGEAAAAEVDEVDEAPIAVTVPAAPATQSARERSRGTGPSFGRVRAQTPAADRADVAHRSAAADRSAADRSAGAGSRSPSRAGRAGA